MSFPQFIMTPQGQRDSSYSDVYANQLRVGMTHADFSLVFGTAEDYGPGQVGVRDQVLRPAGTEHSKIPSS